MEILKKENTIILKAVQDDFTSFLPNATVKCKEIIDENIIVDLSHFGKLEVSQIEQFLFLAKKHKKANKSFVIVASNSNYNAVSEELTVVPTLLEAFDIIELEEIERDLGF